MQHDFSRSSLDDEYMYATMRHPSLNTMEPQISPGASGSGADSYLYRSRRRSSIGTRKRSPESLIPLDAPTQPRKYVTPSATSKKEIPAFFARQRPSVHPSDDEEDELTEEPPAANATDQEKIEWKRRQNTLAARRSRKRKLVQQHQLEEAVEHLRKEKEMWRTRCLTLKQLLQSHGIPCPDFHD